MRVISGIYKGKPIKFPDSIRPTQGIVRKALFDILSGAVGGASFLDLFCGSGSVGIEALSFEAKKVIFVDSSPACIKIVESNLKALENNKEYGFLGGRAEVLCRDAFSAIESFSKNMAKFDIVFLDPPYYEDMAKNCLIKISAYDIVTPNGFIIIQHFKKDSLLEDAGGFKSFKKSKYGDTLLTFFKK